MGLDDESFQDITDAQGTVKQQISPEVNYTAKFILPDYEEQEVENINLNAGEHHKQIVIMKKLV